MSADFEIFRTQMHEGFKEADAAKGIKLLNTGTNHHREYHWRFRTPDGTIINVSMEREER